MKKTDFAMILLIAVISVGVSYAVVSAIPALKASSEPAQVKTIDQYTSELTEPSADVFNKDAINPTVDVTIGGTGSGSPTGESSTPSSSSSSDSDTSSTDGTDEASAADADQQDTDGFSEP